MHEDFATDWWRLLQKAGTPVPTWEQFVYQLKHQFVPKNVHKTARKRWESLRQAGYVTEYNKAVLKAPIEVPNVQDEEAVSRYISGLKPATREYVALEELEEIQETMQLAETYDRVKLKTTNTGQRASEPWRQNKGRQLEPMDLSMIDRNEALARGLCFLCGTQGHLLRNCTETVGARRFSSNSNPRGGANSNKDVRHQLLNLLEQLDINEQTADNSYSEEISNKEAVVPKYPNIATETTSRERFHVVLSGSTGMTKKNQQKEDILLNGLGSPAISGQAWKTFWRMEIPHAIRMPWWRTLQQKIPTNKRLHNIFPSKYNTTCRICQKENESDKHFLVECEYKWRFWMRMMKLKEIPLEICSQGKVWNMILLQQTRPQDVQILSEIGRTMLAIWITHWNCIKQQKGWSDPAAYNMYESIIKPTNDRNFQPKEDKSCNGWITIVQAGTTQGVEACVWKMCRCYQCPNKEGFPGGRPSTDFELVSPFQIIFDPKMKQRDHIDWLLAPWRNLIFMKLQVDRIVAYPIR